MLRFYCVVDDTATASFERRPFVVQYYLANDTVSVAEKYPNNSGRDPYPTFFKRGKLVKGPYELRGPMDSALQKEDYVQVGLFCKEKKISRLLICIC